MFCQISQRHSLPTFRITAFDFQSKISPEECFAFERTEFSSCTTIGAFGNGVLTNPIIDAYLTEHFATIFTFHGIHYNL